MLGNRSTELLQFSHIQWAAEAFLQDLTVDSDPAELAAKLRLGNGHASAFPPTHRSLLSRVY